MATTEHRCTVLVVDDDEEIRAMLRVALTGDGYRVASVPDGREALHYLRSHAETCMILLDLVLPVMDGAQFRRVQLQDRSLAWIPIVIMSATLDGDRRARALGARHFIRKPLNLDEVRQTLRLVGCCQARPRPPRALSTTSW
jgi:CheY-like chemotaxis protein